MPTCVPAPSFEAQFESGSVRSCAFTDCGVTQLATKTERVPLLAVPCWPGRAARRLPTPDMGGCQLIRCLSTVH